MFSQGEEGLENVLELVGTFGTFGTFGKFEILTHKSSDWVRRNVQYGIMNQSVHISCNLLGNSLYDSPQIMIDYMSLSNNVIKGDDHEDEHVFYCMVLNFDYSFRLWYY